MTIKTGFIIGGILTVFPFLLDCSSVQEKGTVLPLVVHPEDNPLTTAKVELGKKLFFDTRLSRDNSISCASCHVPEFAFTDRKGVSEGVGGGKTQRNSPSVLNAGYLETVMYDAHLPTLEMQVIVPIQEHVEMDMNMQDLLAKLSNIAEYKKAAKDIFNREFDAYVLTRAISAFERTLISDNSRFDQYYYGKDKNALTKSEQRGWKLFSEEMYCTKCHPAPHFTTYKAENNGLYADYGDDKGRFRIHHDSTDIGKFKIPSLRNVALTFPYMHDGSVEDLYQIIDHYTAGGKKHWNQSEIVQPFEITPEQKKDVVNFLKSLTDTTYMKEYR